MDTSSATPLAVVGRQPIFDHRLRVCGYELLFRLDAKASQATVHNAEACTARVVVNTFVEIGLENVVGSALAFINVDREFILSEFIRNLPSTQVVLEVLEDVPPDEEVLAALGRLVAAGYRLALDDFVPRDELRPMLDLATMVKLDISTIPREELRSRVDALKRPGLKVVAERVETRADLEACRDAGFDLFQGYFLARPATLQRHTSPNGDRITALQILALLDAPNATADHLEAAISRDVTLSYRLLRVINSAAFGLRQRIESLRQAIVHLGRDRIRSWVSLLVLSGLSDKPGELLASGLVRARMCENLGVLRDPSQSHAYFTAGLFSILDAVLDTPMEQLVETLPLAPVITEALVARAGPIGEALDTVTAYERCEWTAMESDHYDAAQVRDAYLDAVRWSISLREALALN